jgi:hypothetical protein
VVDSSIVTQDLGILWRDLHKYKSYDNSPLATSTMPFPLIKLSIRPYIPHAHSPTPWYAHAFSSFHLKKIRGKMHVEVNEIHFAFVAVIATYIFVVYCRVIHGSLWTTSFVMYK